MRILQWKVKLPTYILKMSWEKEILILTETSGAPNENIVQNRLNMALLNVF